MTKKKDEGLDVINIGIGIRTMLSSPKKAIQLMTNVYLYFEWNLRNLSWQTSFLLSPLEFSKTFGPFPPLCDSIGRVEHWGMRMRIRVIKQARNEYWSFPFLEKKSQASPVIYLSTCHFSNPWQ